MRKREGLSVLITAGGTREDIDAVRSITNGSTGRLGAAIAAAFLESGARVTYIRGETAVEPPPVHELRAVRDTAGLIETLDSLLRGNIYDCVIHSMAVSDYKPCGVTDAEGLAAAILKELGGDSLTEAEMSARIQKAMLSCAARPDRKISSKTPELILTLMRTPKVIDLIKIKQPNTLLFGFKLLAGASERELLEAGNALIDRSGCDYVLANDSSGISGDRHVAFLMDKSGILRRAGTKAEIARIILECAVKRLEPKE